MLGIVNRSMGDIKKALDYHQQALSLAESQKDINRIIKKSIAVSYNSIGNIYLALEQPEQAIENFNKSLALKMKFKINQGRHELS